MQLASVRQQALDEANTRLVVIGCGEWKMIHNYRGEQSHDARVRGYSKAQ